MAEPGLPKDLFEWMQKMWNPMAFPIPGMLTPTVDVKEIERKIGELKSVENWLTMNVSASSSDVSSPRQLATDN